MAVRNLPGTSSLRHGRFRTTVGPVTLPLKHTHAPAFNRPPCAAQSVAPPYEDGSGGWARQSGATPEPASSDTPSQKPPCHRLRWRAACDAAAASDHQLARDLGTWATCPLRRAGVVTASNDAPPKKDEELMKSLHPSCDGRGKSGSRAPKRLVATLNRRAHPPLRSSAGTQAQIERSEDLSEVGDGRCRPVTRPGEWARWTPAAPQLGGPGATPGTGR